MTLAEQTLVQVRIDKGLRDEASDIYAEMGLDLPTAIRMFIRRSVIERGLPFEATLPRNKITKAEAMRAFESLREEAKKLPDMTLDEINKEIDAARAERGVGA